MRMRTLGEGGPEVSVVGLGTNNFGPWIDYEQTVAVIDAALEAGITLFDTADIYGQQMEGAPEIPRGSREYIRFSMEHSLARLRTDFVDVYQMHQPDDQTPIEETLAALHELVQEGKVRYIGNSNFSAQQIEDADRIARERGLTRFVSAQNEYSFVKRDVEDDVLPACERLALGVLPYFPLASGLLTGKCVRGKEAKEGRLAGREIPAERWDQVEALQRYADERGVALLDVAIGGLAAMPAIASVIAGATKPEQVRANVKAGEWEPSENDLAALRALR